MKTTIAPATVIDFAEVRFDQCQSEFKANPNSVNWKKLLSAMLIHQQVQYTAHRAGMNDIFALCEKLAECEHVGEWNNIISTETTGKNLMTALREYAVF
jgi:hypothetical protein